MVIHNVNWYRAVSYRTIPVGFPLENVSLKIVSFELAAHRYILTLTVSV